MQSAFDLAWAVNHGSEEHSRGEKPFTFSRLMVLRLLARTGPRSVKDIAAFLGVSDAAASTIVDRLVSRKLLRRDENREDRRVHELSLTGAGRQLLTNYELARKRLLAEEFRQCSAEELHRASELLDRVSSCIARNRRAAHDVPPNPHSVKSEAAACCFE